ncbi:MAG: NAD(P)H-hydrate dehydratase [Planctomycetota bacterium]
MSAASRQLVRDVARLGARRKDAHKGQLGTVVVLAGSREMLGAAVLCARGALRAGAGLVRVGLPDELLPLLPLAVPEATTFWRRKEGLSKQLGEADAVVVGPGLGVDSETADLVRQVLAEATVPVVLDADALHVIAPLRGGMLAAVREECGPIVLTPHPGEAARLLGMGQASMVQQDRDGAAARLQDESGAIVALKGHGTLVLDGARRYRNGTGNPGMATGGSGDVLAGVCGALLARGLEPFEAVCMAVHVHGGAGDDVVRERGENGMVASDLPDAIAQVMP